MKKNVILVVDDEQEIRNLFFRFLGKKGYTVHLAGSIEEEKDILKEIIPDLIFLDIHLPDGNGLEELQRLRPYGPGCKVIMMSAFDHSEEQKDAYDSGAIAFLSKPFSLSRLNQVIDSRFNISTKPNKENGPNISN